MRRIFLFYFFTHLKIFLNALNVLLYRFKKKRNKQSPKVSHVTEYDCHKFCPLISLKLSNLLGIWNVFAQYIQNL